jgi:hypothetical protein
MVILRCTGQDCATGSHPSAIRAEDVNRDMIFVSTDLVMPEYSKHIV